MSDPLTNRDLSQHSRRFLSQEFTSGDWRESKRPGDAIETRMPEIVRLPVGESFTLDEFRIRVLSASEDEVSLSVELPADVVHRETITEKQDAGTHL